MYRSDPSKQILILAQSSMTKAVDLIKQKRDFEDTEDYWKELSLVSKKLMALQMQNAEKYIKNISVLNDKVRATEIDKDFTNCSSQKELKTIWANLSEEEQVKYIDRFNELKKILK